MDKKWLARLLITLVTTLPVVQADELFPDYIDTGNARLSRCSRAELKAFRLIHVGNAALYLDDCKKLGGCPRIRLSNEQLLVGFGEI